MADSRLCEVISHRTDNGEWFPLLIYAETGLPVTLPLRYAFVKRFSGGSKVLKRRLQNIGWLYEWFERRASFLLQDLEKILRDPDFVDTEDLKQAMVYADNRGLASVLPAGQTVGTIAINRRHDHNLRMQDWREFLEWALEPRNWKTGRGAGRSTPDERLARDVIARELDLFFKGAYRRVPKSRRRAGFNKDEIKALEALLVPDANLEWDKAVISAGKPRLIFSETTRFRNYLIYALMYEVGLRRSEVLKLKTVDLPQRMKHPVTGQPLADAADRPLWSNDGQIQVKRREDDPEDGRSLEPRVKRKDRLCFTPNHLLEDLWHYIESPPPLGRKGFGNGYVFLTQDGNPLSVSAADDVSKTIRRYAPGVFEQLFPRIGHSLHEFSWHRLRHTAAKEILKIFRASGRDDWRTKFKDHFGWANMESAEPYIEELIRADGVLTLRAHDEARGIEERAYMHFLQLEGAEEGER